TSTACSTAPTRRCRRGSRPSSAATRRGGRGGRDMVEARMPGIAVLIPRYNEELTVRKGVTDFRRELPHAPIVVYRNASADQTAEIARDAGAIVVAEKHRGKGNVIASMFRDIDADAYVMVDGDDTYPASKVHELLAPVLEDRADIVVGTRLVTYEKGS